MGFNALVKRQIRAAFKVANDLKTTAVFYSQPIVSFNFNSSESVKLPEQSVTVAGIMGAKRRRYDKDSGITTQTCEFFFISADAPDISSFDKALIGNETWRVVPPLSNDGFLISVNLSREIGIG
jgi:hypothetical protein